MNTTPVVKATCPQCGEVTLASNQVVLTCSAIGCRYEFTCPECKRDIRKPADDRVVRLLESAGVVLRWKDFGGVPMNAPPITPAEIDEFAKALKGDDWLKELMP